MGAGAKIVWLLTKSFTSFQYRVLVTSPKVCLLLGLWASLYWPIYT